MMSPACRRDNKYYTTTYVVPMRQDGLIEGDVEYGDGAVVDLTKLPDDIKRLRIYMS